MVKSKVAAHRKFIKTPYIKVAYFYISKNNASHFPPLTQTVNFIVRRALLLCPFHALRSSIVNKFVIKVCAVVPECVIVIVVPQFFLNPVVGADRVKCCCYLRTKPPTAD